MICDLLFFKFSVWSRRHTQENSVAPWCPGIDSDQQWG